MSNSRAVSIALLAAVAACGEGGIGGGGGDADPVATEGTTIAATVTETVTSETNKVGDQVRVRVSRDVTDSAGRVVIPAGSEITLSIGQIAAGPNRGDQGALEFEVENITIGGETHDLNASVTDFGYEMKGRGIGAAEVAKTGAGAAAGAIVGRVVGGEDKTAIGAVGGAAVGAAIADHSADRDIVVAAGSSVTLVLNGNFTAPDRPSDQ
jgi:hypothetical protein